MPKLTVPIQGMHCRSCEIILEESLKNIIGINRADVNHKTGIADLYYIGSQPTEDEIKLAVENAGYKVGSFEKKPWISKDPKVYKNFLFASVILLLLYGAARFLGVFNISVNTEKTGLLVVFAVGLVAGVSTCMALVGGLVLALSARHAELHPTATAMQKFRPHLYFNLGRIGSYAVLGGIIGVLGSTIRLSAGFLGLITIAVGAVMIFLGLKLVEVFPVLQNKTIALPKSISRFLGINKENKEYSHKGAVLTGALTFFLPCGFTQAMQLYAVSTGSFLQGALIMFLFALGTAPGLLGVGGLSSVFKGQKAKVFFMAAGLAVILLGWVNIANGSRLISVPADNTKNVVSAGDEQVVRMTQNFDGYTPNVFTVEKGRPVKWIIDSKTNLSCASFIVMKKFGIGKPLQKGENVFTFTPTETGEIPFSCSMGMYTGKFIVVEKNQTSSGAVSVNSVAQGGICGVGGGCGCGGGQNNFTPQTGNTAIANNSQAQIIKTVYNYSLDIQPNTFTVKAGQPVKFEIAVDDDGSGCMSTIMIPGLYDTPERLTKGRIIVMDFTPAQKGEYPITCAMGVKRGVIKVI